MARYSICLMALLSCAPTKPEPVPPAEASAVEASPTPDDATPDDATPDDATPDDAIPSDATPGDATEDPSPETRCDQMLRRFGTEAQEHDKEICVDALTSERCGAFSGCFEQCMSTIGIEPAEYDPSDISSSPSENCDRGCRQTACVDS